MPKFIKMGNGGTGFLGHQQSAQRAAQRYAKRRETKPGYPWTGQFTTPEQLEEYFGGDRIECLLCGRSLRTLGVHIRKIHGLEVDEYKARFGIPYSYFLSCAETSALHAAHMTELREEGIIAPATPEQAAKARAGRKDRPMPPVRKVITERNLAIMNQGKTGATAERRKQQAKRGTEEYHRRMRERPHLKDLGRKLGQSWKGRAQSSEHVLARTGFPKKTKEPGA